ncbi:MAG: hypothetical protein ACPLRW_01355 [Moorellales bacterium]
MVLDEVELSNGNLLEIRQFRPNEVVHVEITPAQLGLWRTSPWTVLSR